MSPMSKKILLIDDEQETVELVKARLERENYKIFTANDGQEGLKKARDVRPDLILLDILMPNLGGYGFVQQLRADHQLKNIPVIVLSGRAAMYEAFQKEGVADYLLKPFLPGQLSEKITEFFKKQEQSQDNPPSPES